MVTFSVRVSTDERDLIEDIRALEFGEILSVELVGTDPTYEIVLSEPERRLLKFIRQGQRVLDSITVHQSVPTLVSAPGLTHSGRWECKRRYKPAHE